MSKQHYRRVNKRGRIELSVFSEKKRLFLLVLKRGRNQYEYVTFQPVKGCTETLKLLNVFVVERYSPADVGTS